MAADAPGAVAAGLTELLGGIEHWRAWHLLGVRDLRHRYARSKLGQLWLMLDRSMIGMLSAVGRCSEPAGARTDAVLRHRSDHVGLPSQVPIDCTSIFINHGNLYRNQR
jgi:hypothetical protein